MHARSTLLRTTLATLAGIGLGVGQGPAAAQSGGLPAAGRAGAGGAKRFLVHVHTGPADPNKATLAFLVAAAALREGHAVDVFLAGDGVALLTADALASLEGKGTGRLGAHAEAIAAGGGRFHLSGMSAKSRGLGPELLAGRPAEFARPEALVRLAAGADVVLSY